MKFVHCLLLAYATGLASLRAEINIEYSISDPGAFTTNQLAILNTALLRSEAMWETAITGYQPGINIPSIPISVIPVTAGLASASYSSAVFQGGFALTTSGFINININEIENFANWQGVGANGLNFVDELMAHETGHVLGVGTHWQNNGVYVYNSFQYTGQFGVAAYRAEFVPTATFIPVEDAGSPGTLNAHWNQRMRSSSQEGNPSDPWSLDPRLGITDRYGRDQSLELMTGAIDPDYREPFLSRFTVESMRDLGYTVARFEDFNGDGAVNGADFSILNSNFGTNHLQIDSFCFGDADRDRDVDINDFLLWHAAAGVGPFPNISKDADDILLTFQGPATASYRLWTSTNLLLTPMTSTWTLLESGTFSGGSELVRHTNGATASQRFYRFSMP